MLHLIRRCGLIALVGALIVGTAATALAYRRPGATRMISNSAVTGQPPLLGDSEEPDMTPAGRFIVFTSYAPDLVIGDTNLASDVFLYDTRKDVLERISLSSVGGEATGTNGQVLDAKGSLLPSISANGRYAIFQSYATNLSTEDRTDEPDWFIHDIREGTTELVSIDDNGDAMQVDPNGAAISGNGRLIAFTALNTYVDKMGKTQKAAGVFLRDRVKESTELVAVSSRGEPAQGGAWCPSLGVTGRYIVFASDAWNLVPEDQRPPEPEELRGWRYSVSRVFVRDLVTNKTELVSVTTDGGAPDNNTTINPYTVPTCGRHAISADGRFVTFVSSATNLAPKTTDRGSCRLEVILHTYNVFVYDRKTGRTERVSVTSSGEERPASSSSPSISADGRHVVFVSLGQLDDRVEQPEPLLPPLEEGSNGLSSGCPGWNVYTHDLLTGETTRLTGSPRERRLIECGFATAPVPSRDGRFVGFSGSECPYANNQAFFYDNGSPLGVGGLGPPDAQEGGLCVDGVCLPVCIEDVCLPPGGLVDRQDPVADAEQTLPDTDIIGARVSYRPLNQDMYLRLDLASMGSVSAGGTSVPDSPGILYGIRFEVESQSYEVRAAAVGHTTRLGLFRCAAPWLCEHIDDIHGDIGTIGASVVASLPLDKVGLEDGGTLRGVEAYTALGGYQAGPVRIIDSVRIN